MLSYKQKVSINSMYRERNRENVKVDTSYFDAFVSNCIRDLEKDMEVYVFTQEQLDYIRKQIKKLDVVEAIKGIYIVRRLK